MNKLELIKRLLDFSDNLNDPIIVRLITKDDDGIMISEETLEIISIGNYNKSTTINCKSPTDRY